ncbi:MAG: flagellar hook-basal body protein [Oscillospiraceae bacterium]|nr:flagellar hook-basal body protein [Oscillospiraceae bacterium]
MFKGFYNLTSGMLTQQRNLNVVANNLTNISTAGFKENKYTSSTFDDVMYTRVGNKIKDYQDIGRQSYIRATSQIYTDYTQGAPEPTGISLDFAIEGKGFFAIQRPDGGVSYTRAGSFSLDNNGYLWLGGYGQVLDENGRGIWLGTDKIVGDEYGNIYTENGDFLAKLGVYDFDDYEQQLEHNQQGLFDGTGARLTNEYRLHWRYLERSNTDMVSQMTEMISVQRALQSAAELSKMYDSLMTKAASDVGRL